MKKFILFSIIFLLLTPFSFCNVNAFAAENSSIYAKVEKNDTFIYSSPKADETGKLFEIPNSYFVRLIEDAGNNFYYCAYKDIFGYVQKNDVIAMKGTPVNPFVEANFRVYAPEGLGLYSTPVFSEQYKKATIPFLTDNLTYYGTRTGQEAVPDKSNMWIYCKYSFDTSAHGYVYSVFCDKLPPITTNTERFEVIDTPFLKAQSPTELTSVAMGFIIVGVSLPCLIVLLLLVKPSLQSEGGSKVKLKRRKNKDYFEFDESDLT